MTVYQVEEYYIHINTKDDDAIGMVKDHLENDGHDFEIQTDCIVVDGFCDEMEAEIIESEINKVLGR